jgi:hypothetical protein
MKVSSDEHPSLLTGSGRSPLLKDVEFAGTTSAKKGVGSSGAGLLTFYILGSVFSSVFIVLCNKAVFTRGFSFPLTVSFIAYVFTWLYYEVLKLTGAWKPSGALPLIENFKVAASSVGSISFMNLCLLTNTVVLPSRFSSGPLSTGRT